MLKQVLSGVALGVAIVGIVVAITGCTIHLHGGGKIGLATDAHVYSEANEDGQDAQSEAGVGLDLPGSP